MAFFVFVVVYAYNCMHFYKYVFHYFGELHQFPNLGNLSKAFLAFYKSPFRDIYLSLFNQFNLWITFQEAEQKKIWPKHG